MSRTIAQGGSSTCVVELDEIRPKITPIEVEEPGKERESKMTHRKESQRSKDSNEGDEGALPSPTTASEPLERWNHPRTNMFRTIACFWGFTIMGMNDAAIGALIPYFESYYHLNYTVVALVFLSPLAGYALSAVLNNSVHLKFGQRGVAFMCPVCHLIAYTVAAVHPPFPVLVIFYVLAGFGNGLEDAAWNAWVGVMANTNEVMGVLHGFYGLGATISPLIATSLITRAHLPWWSFYWVMVGLRKLKFSRRVTDFFHTDWDRSRRAHHIPLQLLELHRCNIPREASTDN